MREIQTTPEEERAFKIWKIANPNIPISSNPLPPALGYANTHFQLVESEAIINRLSLPANNLVLQGFTHARLTRIESGIAYVDIAQTKENKVDMMHLSLTGKVRLLQ